MAELVFTVFTSLDGYIEKPGGVFAPPPWSDEVEREWSNRALSRALPAMDRFRVRSLVKGLRGGLFGPRWELAAEETVRKVEIVAKGARKRGEERVLQLCSELSSACLERDWELAWSASGELLTAWPTRLE